MSNLFFAQSFLFQVFKHSGRTLARSLGGLDGWCTLIQKYIDRSKGPLKHVIQTFMSKVNTANKGREELENTNKAEGFWRNEEEDFLR